MKYPTAICRQQFQTPLYDKQNTGFFIAFLMKFRAFSYPSLIISEIIDAERRGYLNV